MKSLGNLKGKVNTALKVLRNSDKTPKIMLATGVVMVVGAGVYACRQTLKLEDKVDDMRKTIDHVKDLKEEGEYVVDTETGETATYGAKEYGKDLTYAYANGCWNIIKLYVGPVAIATVGITLIGGSNKILTDRLAETTLALGVMSDAYNKYRQNVITDLGEEADRKYRTGIETKKNLEMNVIDPETGELVTKKEKKLDVISDVGNIASPYAIILNDCSFWTPDGNYNATIIETYIRILQAQYDRDGYLYLYDIYNTFGILDKISAEAIAMSHQCGFVKGYGDDEIRVTFDNSHLKNDDDIYKRILLMDINCYGAINDLVAKRAWVGFC